MVIVVFQFPYPAATSSNEPTRTIQSLVNIRRDSVKFVRCQPTPSTPAGLKRTESLTGCEQTSVPSCSTRSSLSSGSKAVQPGAFGLQSNNESTDSGVSFRIPNVPSPGTKTRIDSNESHLLTNNQLLKSLAKIVSPGKASTHEFPNSADAESVRVETSGEFVDSSDEEETDNSSQLGPHAYNLEFTFDCDCPITITVYYFAVEDTGTPNGVT